VEGGGDIVYMGGDIESGIRRRGIYGNPGAPFRDGEVQNLSHQKLKILEAVDQYSQISAPRIRQNDNSLLSIQKIRQRNVFPYPK
jgi:hypothetical protein